MATTATLTKSIPSSSPLSTMPWHSILPPTTSPHADDLRRVVMAALYRYDYNLLHELLDNSSQIRPLVALESLWLPLVLFCQSPSKTDCSVDQSKSLLHTTRQQIRDVMLRLPQGKMAYWLVPMQDYLTSTYVAALALNLCDISARIWSWSTPAPGPCSHITANDLVVRYVVYAGYHASRTIPAKPVKLLTL